MSIARRLIETAVRAGSRRLADAAMERVSPSKVAKVAKAASTAKGSAVTEGVATAAMAQIARRSVPAAIIIGGGLLAKHLYDRRRAAKTGGAKTGGAKTGKVDGDEG